MPQLDRDTGNPQVELFGVNLTYNAHLGQLRRRSDRIRSTCTSCRLHVRVDRFLMADQATKLQALGLVQKKPLIFGGFARIIAARGGPLTDLTQHPGKSLPRLLLSLMTVEGRTQ